MAGPSRKRQNGILKGSTRAFALRAPLSPPCSCDVSPRNTGGRLMAQCKNPSTHPSSPIHTSIQRCMRPPPLPPDPPGLMDSPSRVSSSCFLWPIQLLCDWMTWVRGEAAAGRNCSLSLFAAVARISFLTSWPLTHCPTLPCILRILSRIFPSFP